MFKRPNQNPIVKNILIVDDEEDVLFLLKGYLTVKGYNVQTTLTCEHALEIFYLTKPDIVLVDVNVGNTDGRIMCKTIKTQAEYQHIPVILMSADHNNLLKYTDHGATAVIEKPFNLPAVLSAIRLQLLQ